MTRKYSRLTEKRERMMSAVNTRGKVLSIFKRLHKTRRVVFKNDDHALTAARAKINDEFKKNKSETETDKVDELIKKAESVDEVMRKLLVQAEHVSKDRIKIKIRDETYKMPNKMYDPNEPIPPLRRTRKKTSDDPKT